MEQLEKITISNIRKFGEDVVIPIAKGATIFLAPNGTGKTAVFEAIELALTGKVKRLLFPPEPLIRDNQQTANIRLDFASTKFCEAAFAKGANPIITGDHNHFFKNVEEKDLPFLLQLTHFLNQQAGDWFVKANGQAAGSQLDRLSIGREALYVDQAIPTAKRAASAELNLVQRDFDETHNKWMLWEQLLENKKKPTTGLTAELISKSDILISANQIGVKLNRIVENTTDTTDLKLFVTELQLSVDSRKKQLDEQLVLLSSFPELVSEYRESKLQLEKHRDSLKVLNDELSEIIEGIKISEKSLDATRLDFIQKEADLSKDRENLRLVDQLTIARSQAESFNSNILNTRKLIDSLLPRREEKQKEIDSANKSMGDREALEKRQAKLIEDENRVFLLKNTLEDWKMKHMRFTELSNHLIPKISNELTDERPIVEQAQKNLANSQVFLSRVEETFAKLNASNGVIKSAIATIIAETPPDLEECPVCGTEFPAPELRKVMTYTANAIDPQLGEIAGSIEITKEDLNNQKTALEKLEGPFKEKERSLQILKNEVENLKVETEKLRIQGFETQRSIEDAKAYLETLEVKVIEDRNMLEFDQLFMPPLVTAEQLNTLNRQLSDIDTMHKNYTEEIRKNELDFNNLQSTIGVLAEKTKEIDFDNLKVRILANEEAAAMLKNRISELMMKVEGLKEKEYAKKNDISRQELLISNLTASQLGSMGKWNRGELAGEPDSVALETKENSLKTQLRGFKVDQQTLEKIGEALAKWRIIDRMQKIQNDIDQMRGEDSEEGFTKKLQVQIKEKAARLQNVTKNIQILNVFSESLSKELDTVHERIVSINPLWKKLLKRIILEPRFAETELSSYSHYKRAHANVNVKLHGQDVVVSHVASEAQITDLQLTFMLAMAQKYQWTPWKCLLLDDPTQHHDLVHASSVFDLLRDYIVDFDFQLLMATHDPVQAKFFMRKLENDGIPANLCQLKVTSNGVVAQTISY